MKNTSASLRATMTGRFALASTSMTVCLSAAALFAIGLPHAAHAANFLDNLKGQAQQHLGGSQPAPANDAGAGAGALGGAIGGLGLPAISSSAGGNVAGVLTYCIKNNYLNAASAQNVKDKLLSKVGLSNASAQRDDRYREGAAGLLQGSNGSKFNLESIKGNVRQKACDYVLKNAKSLF